MDTISRLPAGETKYSLSREDFSKALQSQNMYRNFSSARWAPEPVKRPQDYGAVPLEQATSHDAYVAFRETPFSTEETLMINPKVPELAGHPAIVLKNDLEDFRAQMPDTPAYEHLKVIAKNYSQKINDILAIPTSENEARAEHEYGRDRSKFPLWAKTDIESLHKSVQDTLYYTPRIIWNSIEGHHVDTPRTVPPSLFTLAAAKAAKLKANGADLSAWEKESALAPVMEKAFFNVGDNEQQIARFLEYVTSETLTDEEKKTVITQFNDLFSLFLLEIPPFTLQELAQSPDRFISAVNSEHNDLNDFILTLRHRVRHNTPLETYNRLATFEHIQNDFQEIQAAKAFSKRLETVPKDQGNAVIDDFVRIVEPLRQQFKDNNPSY